MVVGREMFGLKLVMVMGLLLLVMVPETMQLTVDHPLHRVVERINEDTDRPFLALVLSSAHDEKRLVDSGYFVPHTSSPQVTIAGRQFNIGKFKDIRLIYVVAKSPLAYVSVTVQILLDTFRIDGIIDYGSAGTVSDSLAVADVAVLKATAFTGFWTWKQWERSMEGRDLSSLKFGDFNLPEAGDNKLARIEYRNVLKYTPTDSNKKTFWFPAHEQWLQIASQLKDIPLERCVGESICLSQEPKVVHGVKGSSADIHVSNEAYAQFLNNNLDVSTVDMKSAATASTTIANGVPHIVFRAVTNRPGIPYDSTLATLGSINGFKMVSTFIEHVGVRPRTNYY